MSAGRPRRSAAPDSLRVAFPELTSSESESESDEEENGPGEAGEGGEAATAPTDGTQDGSRADTQGKGLSKKKKRKEPSPSPAGEPDSASGSEFELEVIKNKDGSIVQVEDEDDDDDFDIDVVEESESGDSAAGEKDLDNISIANSEGLDSESDTGKGKQGIKHGKARYFFVGDPNEDVASSGSTNNAGPAMRIIGRTLSATAPASTAPRNRGAKRKDVNLHLPPPLRKIALYDLPYGSAFWPPPTILTKPFDDPAHSPSSASVQQDDHGVQTLSQLSIPQRMMHLKRSAYLPFGPVSDNCVDLGWYKGKWYKTDQGTLKRSERWGGWYDTFATQAKDFDFVQNIECVRFLLEYHACIN